MIANRAILKVNHSEYDILTFNYKFQRDIDAKGRPWSAYYGGDILVQLESSDDTELFRLMTHKEMPAISGAIEVFSNENEHCIRRIEFERAYIYSYEENMHSSGWVPMITTIAISPIRLDFNNNILRLDRLWPRALHGWQKYEPEEVKYVKAETVASIETEVAEIEIITLLTKVSFCTEAGMELNKSYKLRVTRYTNGVPTQKQAIRWQYSYQSDTGETVIVGLKSQQGEEIEVILNNKELAGKNILFTAYISNKEESGKQNIFVNPLFKDGVFLWIETKGTGHTFISVHHNSRVYTYNYGRFDNGFGPIGEGVLIRYSDIKAENYIKRELYRMGANVFEIKDVSPNTVINIFNNIYNKSNEYPDDTETNDDIKRYGKVIDTYILTSNNCTTLSCKILKEAGTNIFNKQGFFDIDYTENFTIPSSLNNFLLEIEPKNKDVENACSTMKKLYPKDNQVPLGKVGSSGSLSGTSGNSSGSSANSSSMENSSSGSGSGKN